MINSENRILGTPKIYFLSTGRAGTNFLYRIITGIYPEIRLTHQVRWSRLINIAGNILLMDAVPSHLVKDVYSLLKKVQTPESTVDPLQSVAISLFLNYKKKWHEHKIVHVVRDPRDYVTSTISWKNQRLRRLFLHHCVPFWQPNPIFCGNVAILKRMKMNKFEHFSWIWNFKNSFFAKMFNPEENYYLVRMEDLINAQIGHQNFQKLFDFLNLPNVKSSWDHLLNRKVNASARNGFANWKSWNSKQAKILDRYCGVLMRKYGYGNEERWIEKLREE